MRPRSQPASTGPGGSHPRIPQAVLGLRAGPRARPLTCPMARGLDGALSRPDTTGGKTPCALFCKRGKRAQGLPLKWKGTPRPVHVSRQGEKFPGGPQEPWLAPAGCSHTHNSCLRRAACPSGLDCPARPGLIPEGAFDGRQAAPAPPAAHRNQVPITCHRVPRRPPRSSERATQQESPRASLWPPDQTPCSGPHPEMGGLQVVELGLMLQPQKVV